MRLPLWLVDAGLRLGVKRQLARVATPQAMRAQMERGAVFLRAPAGARFEAAEIAGPRGRIGALWCSVGPAEGRLLYLHGGAYLAGSTRTHRHLAAALGGAAGMRAFLPDYALAPEHPFPAALEDALACYRWLSATGPVALGGDSAGGGLAAALMLEIQRLGLPRPVAAVLFSPWADLTMQGPSLAANARADAMLPVARMREVIGHYLQGADPADPRASPALGRFEAPPPTLIAASPQEILADDARALAAALRAGDGEVRLDLRPRLPHAWPIFVRRLNAADRTVAEAGAFLRTAAARASVSP